MSHKVLSIIAAGNGSTIIEIECRLSNNLPNIVIVGLANKSVTEARERIRGAFAASSIPLARKRITINLAPADIPKEDSSFDLAMAMSILLASNQVDIPAPENLAFIGELGLDGQLRPVRGVIGKIAAGRAQGISRFCIPKANVAQAQLVPNVNLIAADNISEILNHFSAGVTESNSVPDLIDTGDGKYDEPTPVKKSVTRFSEIAGQEQAKRVLEIAAAGGHNVLLSGPPGTGKTMLAKALKDVLPPLNREEVLEVTHLHSLASMQYNQLISERPFRAPHHSASHVSIIGGGSNLRPGEISLAHRGILFFDELPEFSRDTLEALRQPLEDRTISIARARDTVTYPASFILVATANPCPCGYYGSPDAAERCQCSNYQIALYQQRLSGPILDRIDLYSNVHKVEHDKLLAQQPNTTQDEAFRQRVLSARHMQAQRFGPSNKLNSDMTNSDIKLKAQITKEAKQLLNTAAESLKLSARSYMRTAKVARTIADLEQKPEISSQHITEAIQYRLSASRF